MQRKSALEVTRIYGPDTEDRVRRALAILLAAHEDSEVVAPTKEDEPTLLVDRP